MNIPLRSIRRATLDDLPTLAALWKLEQLSAADLEKRFKEFQVAESEEGEVLGALGVQVVGTEARLHSEAYSHFESADALREKFWDRVKTMGDNQGWVRVWTQLTSPTWRQIGFDPPTPEQLSKLPETLSKTAAGSWFVRQIREERANAPSVDAEFQMLKLAYQSENERLMKRAKVLRMIATIVAAAVAGWILWWGSKLFRYRDNLPPR